MCVCVRAQFVHVCWYMCVYVCRYNRTCTCTCMCSCIRSFVHACMRLCLRVCIRVCVHVGEHVRMHVCKHVYGYMHARMRVCKRIRMHAVCIYPCTQCKYMYANVLYVCTCLHAEVVLLLMSIALILFSSRWHFSLQIIVQSCLWWLVVVLIRMSVVILCADGVLV